MERLQSVSRYCGGPCSWGGTCVYLLVVRWLRRPLPYALPQGDPPEPGWKCQLSGASGPVARTFGGGVGGAIAVVVGVRAAPADQWHAPLVVVLAALSLLWSESERRQRTSGTHLWWWCWRRYRCCRRSQSGASGPVARTFGGGVGGAIAVVVGVRAAPADQWHAPLVVGVGGAIAVVVGVRAAPADQWHELSL
ncbi:hypothetical protein ACJJTC_017454 [Scirpophaga incertulas]